MTHPYFSPLNWQDNPIWEGETALNRRMVDTALWQNEASLPAESTEIDKILDAFAAHCRNFDALYRHACGALFDYLIKDASFIEFYAEELHVSGLPELNHLLKQFSAGHPEHTRGFIRQLQVTGLGLWLENNVQSSGMSMDFMLSPEQSDQILCVRFDLNGHAYDVAWES